MVLYFSVKVIQAAETIDDVLMNSLGLLFVVEIDDRVGAWVASTFKDGHLLLQLINLLLDMGAISSWQVCFRGGSLQHVACRACGNWPAQSPGDKDFHLTSLDHYRDRMVEHILCVKAAKIAL